MDQVLRNLDYEPDTVEIVVYISDPLEEQKRGNLVAALGNDEGIIAAEFCPLRYHLMLVRYDRDLYSSQDVLARVKSQNLNAKLIGPVCFAVVYCCKLIRATLGNSENVRKLQKAPHSYSYQSSF